MDISISKVPIAFDQTSDIPFNQLYQICPGQSRLITPLGCHQRMAASRSQCLHNKYQLKGTFTKTSNSSPHKGTFAATLRLAASALAYYGRHTYLCTIYFNYISLFIFF